MKTLNALNNWILLRKIDLYDNEEKLNIILPENEEKNYGEIVDIGPACSDSNHISLGDVVYFNPFGTASMQWQDETLYIIKDTDMIAVVKNDEQR